MSIKKNLLKNGLASLINKGIKVAEQLLLVPFFISAWGAAYYGEWLTLTIIPSIIGLSDFGFGTAASNSFVLNYSANKIQEAANIAKSGFFSINIIVVSTLVLSFVIIQLVNYYDFFDKSLIAKDDAILALYFLMASRVLGFYQPLNESYFRSVRKASLSINLNGFNSGINLAAGILILIFNGGIVLFAFSNLVCAFFFLVAHTLKARSILPQLSKFKGIILIEDIKGIFLKGFGFLLSPIWQAIFFQGTTFAIRIVLGPIAVTIFNTVRTLCRFSNQINSIVIASILPEIQFEIGSGNFTKARKLFRFGLFFVIIITFIGVFFLYFGGTWFYQFWTGKVLDPPSMVWNILIIGIVFNAIWWMSSDILIASNKPYEFTLAGVIVAIFSVICTYLLLEPFGLIGAAFGSLLLDLLLFFYVVPKCFKLLQQNFNTFISDSTTDIIWYFKKMK